MGIFRSIPFVSFALACAMSGVCAAQSQLPPVAPQQPTPAADDPSAGRVQNGLLKDETPLTPDEKRQKEIDKYNPLSPVDPAKQALPGDRAPTSAPNANGGTYRPLQPNETHAAPIPGSVADSSQPSSLAPPAERPEAVTGSDDSGADQRPYNGPAVLSRSYTISRPLQNREVKWVWTLGSNEIWQNGLITGETSGGMATTGSSFGTATNFSFSGRHLWKKDQIGIDYGVSYNRYTSAAGYNGANQNLSVDYEHYFTRHLSLNLVENGSILSQNYSLQNPMTEPGVSAANLDLGASAISQVLDLTTRQFFTNVGLTWQQSARLSYNLSEGFFAVDRTGYQLISTTGYQSQADVNYRLTKKMTVGAYYSYLSYLYTQHISASDSNIVGLIYSYAFNRSTQLRFRGGLARVESLSYTVVPIDPTFAALVGASYGIADVYHRNYTSDISAQFVRDLGRKRSMNVSFARGIAPGNGLILTSFQQTLSASFTTALFRTYLLSFSGGKSELASQAQNTGSYSYNYIGMTLSHALPRGPAANFSVNYRTYNITGLPGIQHQFSVSSGFSWSPGPGRLW